jgi:hypothetical protein
VSDESALARITILLFLLLLLPLLMMQQLLPLIFLLFFFHSPMDGWMDGWMNGSTGFIIRGHPREQSTAKRQNIFTIILDISFSCTETYTGQASRRLSFVCLFNNTKKYLETHTRRTLSNTEGKKI